MRSSPALLPGDAFELERLPAPGDAVRRYLERVALAPPGVEDVALDDAYGRVLARDAVASDPIPGDDRSTMDGFALASASTPGTLRIAGEIRMGSAPPGPLAGGTAMRIPTGGVLPDGADAVVPFEDAAEDGGRIVPARLSPGENVAPRGGDIRAGECVLAAGRRIGGAELGVLATLGAARVPVYRRPVIAIVSTGDELVAVDRVPGRGQIRDSNRYAIAGTLRAMGALPRHAPRAADTLEGLATALATAREGADAVILTGGSSVGARDLTPDAIDGLGPPGVIVHGIRVKPGKPTVLAATGTTPIVGLPGNPSSALMILEAVVAPIVRALTGETAEPRRRCTVAKEPIVGRPGWTWYVPVREGPDGAVPIAIRSSQVSLLARASGYVVVSDPPRIEAGQPVDVRAFSGSWG